MAILAIKGHKTRGSEVIALLEMLGGKNKRFFNCARQTCVYFIGNDNDISMLYLSLADENFVVFTLEEFETRFPYKVGNKVTYNGWDCTVIGMEWENNTNTILYIVKGIDFSQCTYVEYLQPHKEQITREEAMGNFIAIPPASQDKDTLVEIDLTRELCVADKVRIVLGDYEFKEENGETYLVKKRPQYPKTYAECCEVLGVCADDCFSSGYKCSLLTEFQELVICLDAYCKIAGEEMGLGKPWEPDWTNNYQKKWTINFYQGEVNLTKGPNVHFILAFPTEEMRNAFYENFKDIIEACKELL